jgi:hypothetical protein
MSTTCGKRWGLACAALVWAVMGLAVGAENAQTLTLKDTRGRAIEIRPTSASDAEVVGIRSSDQKEVKIALDTLDAESQKRINGWRIETGRSPRKEVSMVIKSSGSKPKEYLVKFRVPDGSYNSRLDNNNAIHLKFDKLGAGSSTGTFYIAVDPINRKKEEAVAQIFINCQKGIESRLSRLTPTERIKIEEKLKIEKVSHGDFTGYRIIEDLDSGYGINTTNGNFFIHVSLMLSPNRTEKSLIESEDVLKILGTLQIAEKP